MRDTLTRIETLPLSQWCVSHLLDLDEGLSNLDLKVLVNFALESMAYALHASILVPSKLLQQDRVIFTCPATLWDNVKAKLGFKHSTTEVRLSEYLLFPDISIPKYGETARVAVEHRVLTRPAGGWDDNEANKVCN